MKIQKIALIQIANLFTIKIILKNLIGKIDQIPLQKNQKNLIKVLQRIQDN